MWLGMPTKWPTRPKRARSSMDLHQPNASSSATPQYGVAIFVTRPLNYKSKKTCIRHTKPAPLALLARWRTSMRHSTFRKEARCISLLMNAPTFGNKQHKHWRRNKASTSIKNIMPRKRSVPGLFSVVRRETPGGDLSLLCVGYRRNWAAVRHRNYASMVLCSQLAPTLTRWLSTWRERHDTVKPHWWN